MRNWTFVGALLLLVLPEAGWSATYYIDFASGSDSNSGTTQAAPWKRAPGMNGFAGSYTHSAGDHFIFVGGVTWDSTIAKWNISNSGAPGTPDYYGVDKTWYKGSSWTRPIFDGGSQNPIPSALMKGYWYVTGSYITFDNLQVQNFGVSGIAQGNYGIWFWNDHDITVQNMVLAEQARIALLFEAETGTTLSNFTFVGNDISSCVWGIGIGAAAANTIYDQVVIHDNVFHDFHSQIANGAHTDGVILFNGNHSNSYVGNVQFYNNQMYGDWSRTDSSKAGVTALLYCSACGNAITIYNNYGSDTAATSGWVFEFYTMPQQGPVRIYNNSFKMDTTATGWGGFVYVNGEVDSLTIENNIFVGAASVYDSTNATTTSNLVSDYNDFYAWQVNMFANMKGLTPPTISYSQFKAHGWEAHGLNSDPRFVSSTNLRLQRTSPAIGAGINLSPVFATDAVAQPRPGTGHWDMGAYQQTTPPSNVQSIAH
jgi:hypothetical protein